LFRLVLESHDGRALAPREKHEPAGDIDTVLVASLKALDPNRPIREAGIYLFNVDVKKRLGDGLLQKK
jgi:hypothetical protein